MHHFSASSLVYPGSGGSSPFTFIRSSNEAMVFHRPEFSWIDVRQLRRQINAVQSVIDLLAALLRIRRHEILMDRELNQVQPVAKRRPLALVQVGNRFPAHLPVQNFHTVESHPPGVFNHALDGILVALEVPVRIRGDAEPGAPLGRRVRRARLMR